MLTTIALMLLGQAAAATPDSDVLPRQSRGHQECEPPKTA